MSWVWEHGPSEQGELLVLLALADFCKDDGRCFPAVATIGEKARMSERNARRVLRKLEGEWIETKIGGGRGGLTEYRVLMKPGHNVPPDNLSPRTSATQKPGHPGHETRTSATGNPDTAMSAEPSGNRKGNRKGTVRGRARASPIPIPPDWEPSPEDFADAFERGFSEHEVESEARKFRDYHRAHGSKRVDWSAAYRKWLADAPQFAATNARAGGARGMVAALRARGAGGPLL
jgi:hypothetical protein